MINNRSIVSIGFGFGAYAEATIGFITQQAYVITQYWGGAGNYREYKRKKPPLRIVKTFVKEIAREIIPNKTKPSFYTSSIDLAKVSAMIQFERKEIVRQFVEEQIKRKIREEQDEEDFLLLCCF
jgi:hypothetical protein